MRKNVDVNFIIFQSEHGIGRFTRPDGTQGAWTAIELAWISGKHCTFTALDTTDPFTVTLTGMTRLNMSTIIIITIFFCGGGGDGGGGY